MSDLAAAAAIVAAGISLINVGITARLASRGDREQWRRDEERPIVARCLTLSAEISREWWAASVAKEDSDRERPGWMSHSQKGRELLHELRFEVAQLDLLASSVVREAAHDLLSQHAHEGDRVVLTILGADDDEGRRHAKAELTRLLNAVFYGAREDLGLDVGKPGKRLMRKVNSAIYGS